MDAEPEPDQTESPPEAAGREAADEIDRVAQVLAGQGVAEPTSSGKERTGARMVRAIQQTILSGPLPTPESFAEYERVLPGAAERILQMAEREAQYRHTLGIEGLAVAKSAAAGQLALAARGQVFAFVLALLAIGGGIVLGGIGKSAIGLTSILSSLAALVSVFIYSKYHQRRLAERVRRKVAHEEAEDTKDEPPAAEE